VDIHEARLAAGLGVVAGRADGDPLVESSNVVELGVVEQAVDDGLSVVPGLPKM